MIVLIMWHQGLRLLCKAELRLVLIDNRLVTVANEQLVCTVI